MTATVEPDGWARRGTFRNGLVWEVVGGPGWAGTVVRGNPKPKGTTHKTGILGRPPWAQDCAARVGVQALGEPPCASAFP